MRRRAVLALVAVLSLGGVAGCTAGLPVDPLQPAVDAVYAAGATGVLARVQTADGDQVVRAGTADVATGEPVPWDAYYRIGSTTKTFTAAVVLQLVDEGAFALADTVEQWLPGVVSGNGNDGNRITVADLLRQTSGLNDYDETLPWVLARTAAAFRSERFHVYSAEELVAAAMAKPPQWLPDPAQPTNERRWGYSNTNYLLAGMIVERATGRPWAEEVHNRIIEPLALRDTMVLSGSAHLPRPHATGYTQFPDSADLVDTTVFTSLPDAPIVSTTRDVGTFFRALFGGQLLAPGGLAEMTTTVPTPDEEPPGSRYGMGIGWRPAPGCPDGIWLHGGTLPGFNSEAAVTADGSRAAMVVAMTWRPGTEQQEQQDGAVAAVVDAALCG